MKTLFTAGVLTLATALNAVPAVAQDAPSADTVLATVNGTEITLGHLVLMRAQLPQQYQNLPADVLFNGILDQLIEQTMISASVADDTPYTRYSIDNEIRGMRANQALDALLKDAVSEDDLKAAYDAKYADMPEEFEYNASHILLETEEDARAVIEDLNNGADFAETAAAKSIGPSAEAGGQLGWFGLGQMVAEFENGVSALEVEQISEPVQTQFGWHVIRLNDKRVKPAPEFEAVRAELEREAQGKLIDDYIAGLKAGASVEKMVEGIDPGVVNDLSILQQ